jgi:uncharacterized protein HemX
MVPGLKYQNLAYLGVALALLWALVVASGSRAAMGVMAVLTVALIAGGVWVWRWIQKQQRLANLVTAAQGAESFYTLANNETRIETPDEAREQDRRTLDAWTGHEHLYADCH